MAYDPESIVTVHFCFSNPSNHEIYFNSKHEVSLNYFDQELIPMLRHYKPNLPVSRWANNLCFLSFSYKPDEDILCIMHDAYLESERLDEEHDVYAILKAKEEESRNKNQQT